MIVVKTLEFPLISLNSARHEQASVCQEGMATTEHIGGGEPRVYDCESRAVKQACVIELIPIV
jgi:hypothetical protein